MKQRYGYIILGLILLLSCKDKDTGGGSGEPVEEVPIVANYNPTAYEAKIPDWLPNMEIPADNPMTEEGINLGRMLFYDRLLSVDGTVACASCHFPERSFVDGRVFSFGVNGAVGKRNAMSLINVGFHDRGLLWDGEANTLEEQATMPIEDHLEMNDSWENVEQKLQKHDDYPKLFRAAFGIEFASEITKDLAVKAIAQFERTLVSGNSRYDRIVNANDLDAGFPTDAEERGIRLFFFELSQQVDHPGCSHCHGGPLFTNNRYMNNGIDSVQTLNDFEDLGRGEVTGRRPDNGKFKVPTLRNIELTAPYMHDGRFETLEEVLDHYSSGGHFADNLDANIRPFEMSERDKEDLIAFLKMLTDTTFVNNKAFQSPF
ncbi:MAG: cytochrome c peroxidase [Bacteroidota bacterium]